MDYVNEYVDDMSGKPLEAGLIKTARAEEMSKLKQHDVYTKVPIAECVAVTGKQPIGSKWIDINKGDEAVPTRTCSLRRHHSKQRNACFQWS